MNPKKTVLVVDDDLSIREVLVRALEFEGYHVIEAFNGADGLEKIRNSPRPSLILLDLLMPVLDGQGFLKAISADGELSKIPVLMLSATGESKDIPGVAGFLKKPFEADVLFKTITRHIA